MLDHTARGPFLLDAYSNLNYGVEMPRKTRSETRALRALKAEARNLEGLTLTVEGSCMSPVFESGAQLRIFHQPFYLAGDVIAVYHPSDGRVRVHRLLGYFYRRLKVNSSEERREWTLAVLCLADDSQKPDLWVSHKMIIGRVKYADGTLLSEPSSQKRIKALISYSKHILSAICRNTVCN